MKSLIYLVCFVVVGCSQVTQEVVTYVTTPLCDYVVYPKYEPDCLNACFYDTTYYIHENLWTSYSHDSKKWQDYNAANIAAFAIDNSEPIVYSQTQIDELLINEGAYKADHPNRNQLQKPYFRFPEEKKIKLNAWLYAMNHNPSEGDFHLYIRVGSSHSSESMIAEVAGIPVEGLLSSTHGLDYSSMVETLKNVRRQLIELLGVDTIKRSYDYTSTFNGDPSNPCGGVLTNGRPDCIIRFPEIPVEIVGYLYADLPHAASDNNSSPCNIFRHMWEIHPIISIVRRN
jgi:hypothetical protein